MMNALKEVARRRHNAQQKVRAAYRSRKAEEIQLLAKSIALGRARQMVRRAKWVRLDYSFDCFGELRPSDAEEAGMEVVVVRDVTMRQLQRTPQDIAAEIIANNMIRRVADRLTAIGPPASTPV